MKTRSDQKKNYSLKDRIGKLHGNSGTKRERNVLVKLIIILCLSNHKNISTAVPPWGDSWNSLRW